MRYGYVTFRSHPLDKNLDDYFVTLLQPLQKKTKKYLLGTEKKNTLEQHFHFIFQVPDSADLSNIRNRFTTQPFKKFFAKIKNEALSTQESTCLDIQLVGKTPEDEMKALGYCAKDGDFTSKGFTDDEITDAIHYQFTTARLDHTQPMEQNWKIPTPKTALAVYEDFSKKTGVPASAPDFFLQATRDGICHMNIPPKARKIMRASLIVRNEDTLDPNKKTYYENQLTDNDNEYYSSTAFEINYLTEKLDNILSWIKDQEIDIPEKFTNY